MGYLNYCVPIFDAEVINQLNKKQKGVNKVQLKLEGFTLTMAVFFLMLSTSSKS